MSKNMTTLVHPNVVHCFSQLNSLEFQSKLDYLEAYNLNFQDFYDFVIPLRVGIILYNPVYTFDY